MIVHDQTPERVVRLPNGRLVRLGAYVEAWRTLKAMPPEKLIKGFDHFPTAAGEIRRKMAEGTHDRINRHIPNYGKGRKWEAQWERDARHTASRVNTYRLIVRTPEVHPVELRARLRHRIDDDA